MVRRLILTLGACLLLSSPALAAEMVIGVADLQQAARCEANIAAKEKYEPIFNAENEEFGKKMAAFEKNRKNFETNRPKDQASFDKRIAALQKEEQEVRTLDMKRQQRINAVMAAVNEEMAQLAITAAAEVAKEKGLNLVLAQNSILYADDTLDVTEEVVETMNRLWKEDGSKVFGAQVEADTALPKAEAKPQPKPAPKKK